MNDAETLYLGASLRSSPLATTIVSSAVVALGLSHGLNHTELAVGVVPGISQLAD